MENYWLGGVREFRDIWSLILSDRENCGGAPLPSVPDFSGTLNAERVRHIFGENNPQTIDRSHCPQRSIHELYGAYQTANRL